MEKKNSKAFKLAKNLMEGLPVPEKGKAWEDFCFPPDKRSGSIFLLFMGGLSVSALIAMIAGIEIDQVGMIAIIGGITCSTIVRVMIHVSSGQWKEKNPVKVQIWEIYKVLSDEEKSELVKLFDERILLQAQNLLLEKIDGKGLVGDPKV